MAFTVATAYHIVAVIAILLGTSAAFFGCRIFRIFLALAGFVIAGVFGFALVYYFISPNLIAAAIVGAILAIVGSVVMAHFAGFGAFLIGTAFGTFISVIIIATFSTNYMQEDDTRDITLLGFSIMFGILGIHFRRIAIVGGTSVLGSYGLVSGVDHFVQSGFSSLIPKMANGHLSDISPGATFFVFVVAYVLISAAGVIIQYRQMTKFDMKLYPGEEFETYNTSVNFDVNSGLLSIFAKLFYCKKKVTGEVPLLEVVSLEDY